MTLAAALQAGAAVVLVFITAYYAKKTRDLASETRRMARAMGAAEERAEKLRRRERSERAVISALDALRHPRLSEGMGAVRMEIASDLQHALMWESPLVDDPAVQGRMRACSEAARILSWNDPRLGKEGTDRGAASLRLQRLATSTRATLEAYLTEQPLPEWSDLPDQTSAFAWVVRPLGADE